MSDHDQMPEKKELSPDDFARIDAPDEHARKTVATAPDDFAARPTVQADPAAFSHDAHTDFDNRLQRVMARKHAQPANPTPPPPRRPLITPALVALVLGTLVMAGGLLVLAFFLPPLSQVNPVLDALGLNEDETYIAVLTAREPRISVGGLTVEIDPAAPGDDFSVDVTSISAQVYRAGNVPSAACAAADTLPRNTTPLTDAYALTTAGDPPPRVGLRLPIPQDVPTVDVYGLYGSEERWRFIPTQRLAGEPTLVTDLPSLPRCVVGVAPGAVTPLRSVDIGLGQRPDSAILSAADRVFIRGMQPTPEGALRGILPGGLSAEANPNQVPLIANYDTPEAIDTLTLEHVLSSAQTRRAHSANIATFTTSGGYRSVALDYRELPLNYRDAFSQFVSELSAALAAQEITLVLFLPAPTFDAGWTGGAYDWRTLGIYADELILRTPTDPTADLDAILVWATGEAERQRLGIAFSALSAEVAAVGDARLVAWGTAWEGITGVQLTAPGSLALGTALTANLESFYEPRLGYDDALHMPYVHYLLADELVRAFWLTTPEALQHRAALREQYGLGGVVWLDMHNPGTVPGIARAVDGETALPSPADALRVEWTVRSPNGEIISQAESALNAPATYTLRAVDQTLTVSAALRGVIETELGTVELDLATANLEPVSAAPVTDVAESAAIPAPAESASEPEEVVAIPVVTAQSTQDAMPSATPTPGMASAPAATATPAAPIIPAEIEGTLPPDFALGAHFSGIYEDERLDYLRRAGMTWVKIQIRYSPGMNADDFGWQVQLNHENGFRVLWGVVGEPEDLLEPGYYDEYAQFVGRLAEIGSDAIEIWNEVNLDREWPQGRVDAAMYTEFLAASYTEIKARNPNTLVISAGLAPTGFFGGRCTPEGCDDDVYYREMAAAGAGQYMDCIGAHYNEGIISPTLTSGDPRDTDSGTRYLQTNTARAADPFNNEIPVCYTELGYLTSEGYGELPSGFAWAQDVTLEQQAAWLGTAALINAQRGIVDMMIIWNLDKERFDEDPMAGYAIIRPDGSCPACDTLGSLWPQEQ